MKPSKKHQPHHQQCPCESGKPYQSCCEPLHLGNPAQDAEALMRSRYSAYALNLTNYLLETWHPETRPEQLTLDDPPIKWLGLSIINHEKLSDTEAVVEFIARYKVGGNRAEKMHEISQFSKQNQRWLYVSGKQIAN